MSELSKTQLNLILNTLERENKELRQKLDAEIEKNALLKISANQLSAVQNTIDTLNEKLEAEEAEKQEFQNLYLLLNPSAIELPDAGTFEIALKVVLDDLKSSQQIIREAMEQKPYAMVETFGIAPNGKHAKWLIPFEQVAVGTKLYAAPVPAMPAPKQEPVGDRYCGHSSLADMVRTHTHVWRDLLECELARNNRERPYINHELNALTDIEGAIKFELQNPFNPAPPQAAAMDKRYANGIIAGWNHCIAGDNKILKVAERLIRDANFEINNKPPQAAAIPTERQLLSVAKMVMPAAYLAEENYKICSFAYAILSAAPKPKGK